MHRTWPSHQRNSTRCQDRGTDPGESPGTSLLHLSPPHVGAVPGDLHLAVRLILEELGVPSMLTEAFHRSNIPLVAYDVEFTDEFRAWWETLEPDEQDAIARVVRLLEEKGPALSHPYSSGIEGSAFSHMRELRIQHRGRPYRVLYAFDPRRIALLLIGGDKTGQDRWYEQFIPVADRLYDEHLKAISKEVNDG